MKKRMKCPNNFQKLKPEPQKEEEIKKITEGLPNYFIDLPGWISLEWSYSSIKMKKKSD